MAPTDTFLITGANGGLGTQVVRRLIADSALASTLYGLYTVRNPSTATSFKQILSRAPAAHKHSVEALDLGKLKAVRAVADSINSRVTSREIPPIRALVLCAGYQEGEEQDFSEDGYAMSFQANYLSHWLLTLLLLKSMDPKEGRIVVLGSWTHDPHDERNKLNNAFADEKWKTIFHDTESLAKGTWCAPGDIPGPMAGYQRYGAGKLCDVMMIYELQRRLNTDPSLSNISVLGLDPGGMPSGIARRNNDFMMRFNVALMHVFAPLITWFMPNGAVRTPYKSAGDVLRCAFNTKELGEHPKALYLNGTLPLEPSKEAKDEGKTGMLWRDSVKYAGLKEGDTVLKAWQ